MQEFFEKTEEKKNPFLPSVDQTENELDYIILTHQLKTALICLKYYS